MEQTLLGDFCSKKMLSYIYFSGGHLDIYYGDLLKTFLYTQQEAHAKSRGYLSLYITIVRIQLSRKIQFFCVLGTFILENERKIKSLKILSCTLATQWHI